MWSSGPASAAVPPLQPLLVTAMSGRQVLTPYTVQSHAGQHQHFVHDTPDVCLQRC